MHLKLDKPLKLLNTCREDLRKPFGIVISEYPPLSTFKLSGIIEALQPSLFITVGDFVTYNTFLFGDKHYYPNISIIDNKIKREHSRIVTEHYSNFFKKVINTWNPPGMITPNAIESINNALKLALNNKRILLIVNGEEDLLVIPLVLMCKNKSIIVYGLWRGAMVVIITSKRVREVFKEILLNCFTTA